MCNYIKMKNNSYVAPTMRDNRALHQKAELQVYQTNELGIFKLVNGNRPPNPQHIRRLKESMLVYGVLLNPIIINEKFEVIDGQHRLLAAKEIEGSIYYVIANGYNLRQIHALNQNQKNWTTADFLEGYVCLGVESYIELKSFWERHDCFNLQDCIAMCSNITQSSGFSLANKVRPNRPTENIKEIFNEGTWKTRNMEQAERDAERIKLVETFYLGFNRSIFVGTMLSLFQNKNFDFNEFMAKLRLQPTALVDCANREQMKALIEDIYNFRRREKVNLRFT